MIKRLSILFFLFLIVSCKKEDKIPADVIMPEKMQNILWDYFKADAYCAEIIKKDISKNDTLVNLQLQKTIFNHYGITAENFYKSYKYYVAHPDKITPILDSMAAKQDRTIKTERKPFFNNNYE